MEVKNSTFWGLILQPGKRYEQVVEKSFHVSMAALDITGSGDKSTAQVMINVDGQEFILCHLSKNRNPQQTLDLNFQGGDSLALYVDGQSPQAVHLTGFYNELDDDDDMEGLTMSDMSDEEEVPELVAVKPASLKKKATEKVKEMGKGDAAAVSKRKGSPVKESPQKKTKIQPAVEEESDDDDDDGDEEEDDEDEEDEVEDGEDEEVEEGFSDEEDEDDDGDDDDEEDDDEDDDEDDSDDDDEEEVDEPPIPLKKSKAPALKKEKASPEKGAKTNGAIGMDESPKKKKGAAQNSDQVQKTPVQQEKKAPQTPKSAKRTIGGGVMIEDMIVGNGSIAKRGRPVSVYYVGRLKQNNKQFDQTTGGPGFKFRLGGKEVIKGWDVGVEGMKVGGKRRITCPPHMAYGARGSPPVIPPNSALVFDVTLKNVH